MDGYRRVTWLTNKIDGSDHLVDTTQGSCSRCWITMSTASNLVRELGTSSGIFLWMYLPELPIMEEGQE
jgi:hypothetical protein